MARRLRAYPVQPETPDERIEMRNALNALYEAADAAFATANRIPAYHGYTDQLMPVIKEILAMRRMA